LRGLAEAIETAVRGSDQSALGLNWGEWKELSHLTHYCKRWTNHSALSDLVEWSFVSGALVVLRTSLHSRVKGGRAM
jgi:hypothetical protein